MERSLILYSGSLQQTQLLPDLAPMFYSEENLLQVPDALVGETVTFWKSLSKQRIGSLDQSVGRQRILDLTKAQSGVSRLR
jgi:hypothetical protein